MFKLALRCVLIACLAMLAGCPKSASKGTALDEIQYTWSAAIRWGDFEGAWGLVDPKVREAHPMTDLDFSRFKQVQISTYRDTGSSIVGGMWCATSKLASSIATPWPNAACATASAGAMTRLPKPGG